MDIASLNTDYYSKVASDYKNDKLANASKKDYSNSSDEELMEVCKDFESYFVEQVLKQAMSTFTSDEETSSGAMSTLQSYNKENLIKEYAEKITENQDMGLAKTLFEQMKRNYSSETVGLSKDKEADLTSAVEANSTALSDEG